MSAKIAIGFVLLGVVLIMHALSRVDHATFENGTFLFVVLEMIAGALCLVAPIVAIGIGLLFF